MARLTDGCGVETRWSSALPKASVGRACFDATKGLAIDDTLGLHPTRKRLAKLGELSAS
jgi:hypothetical protein